MIGASFSIPNLTPGLAALVVLGQADRAMLADVLGQKLSDQDLASLASNSQVLEENSQFILASDTAAKILSTLEQDDLTCYRLLHARAIWKLGKRLRDGDTALEPTIITIFDRFGIRLLTDGPKRLDHWVEYVRGLPLTSAMSHQLCDYFEAVKLRKDELYDQALAKFDAILVKPNLDRRIQGRTLNSRGLCYHIIGRLGDARAGYHKSLAISQQVKDRLNEGLVLLNMGILAYELRSYDEAETRLRQAAAVFLEIGSAQWLAATNNELGLIHRDQGHWSEALNYFEKFVTQRRAEGSHDYVGRGLNNIGEVLIFQGRLTEASDVLHEALDKMNTRVYRIDTHLNLGLVYQAYENFGQAEISFSEALDLTLEIGRRDILPHVYYHLGDLFRQQGDNVAAQAQLQAAAEAIETIRAPLQLEELKISLLGRWQQVYEALVLNSLARESPDQAFMWAERSRARAFADNLLVEQPVSTSLAESNEQNGHPLVSTVVTIDALQARLPANAAVLCYFTTGVLDYDVPLLKTLTNDNPVYKHLLTPARTILFVVTKQSLTVHECQLDPNMFHSASPRRLDPNRILNPIVQQRLYSALIGIAKDTLTAKQLYVIPHGPLHHVPFAALFDQQAEQPLKAIEPPRLTYVPSATVLAGHCFSPLTGLPPDQSCLAVGYNGVQNGRALRYTEPEANMVARLLEGQVYIGSQPKKDRLRKAVSNQRWLHIACHGWFNHDNPLESYLETGFEERLTAFEVMQEWQLQAELVTLSACQTGVSRVLRGDEPMGLIRAFLSAGAKAVLVSQWAVEDLPTFLLMQRFYQEIQSNENINLSAALHIAQQWVRDLSVFQIKQLLINLAEDELLTCPDCLPTCLPAPVPLLIRATGQLSSLLEDPQEVINPLAIISQVSYNREVIGINQTF